VTEETQNERMYSLSF